MQERNGDTAPHELILISDEVRTSLRAVAKGIHEDDAQADAWLPLMCEALQRWIVGDHSSELDLPLGTTFEGRPQIPVWWLWEEHYLAIFEQEVRIDNGPPELEWGPLSDLIDPELWGERS